MIIIISKLLPLKVLHKCQHFAIVVILCITGKIRMYISHTYNSSIKNLIYLRKKEWWFVGVYLLFLDFFIQPIAVKEKLLKS